MPQRRKHTLHSHHRRRETYENERAINHYPHSRYYPPQEPTQSCCMAFLLIRKTSHYIQVSTIIKRFAYPKFPLLFNHQPHPFQPLLTYCPTLSHLSSKFLKPLLSPYSRKNQPSSVAPMWLWTQTNTSSREPKKKKPKGSNATTNQHPRGTWMSQFHRNPKTRTRELKGEPVTRKHTYRLIAQKQMPKWFSSSRTWTQMHRDSV